MPERVPTRVLRRGASELTARAVVTIRLLRPHCRRRARRRRAGAGAVAVGGILGGMPDEPEPPPGAHHGAWPRGRA
ncbi:hypothetical protein [Cellulosimicrobium protaetiae]|uniref:Uncharacterized protein n=1 Tax=Cellulosimicrobium protaetiae TaxID=2587808 RepID=A0A6M5UER0_9MICO|nr:hypothetical protein [Cellulosimicrobium protaetiae]QJW35713.1 hypothetical protein FIC82_005365 [Cellulosimicrobium protaetiae]